MKDALKQPVDIVVSTPQTLIELHSDPKLVSHKLEDSSQQRLIYFSDVKYMVLDEADTLLGKGFREEVMNGVVLPVKQRHLKSPQQRT